MLELKLQGGSRVCQDMWCYERSMTWPQAHNNDDQNCVCYVHAVFLATGRQSVIGLGKKLQPSLNAAPAYFSRSRCCLTNCARFSGVSACSHNNDDQNCVCYVLAVFLAMSGQSATGLGKKLQPSLYAAPAYLSCSRCCLAICAGFSGVSADVVVVSN